MKNSEKLLKFIKRDIKPKSVMREISSQRIYSKQDIRKLQLAQLLLGISLPLVVLAKLFLLGLISATIGAGILVWVTRNK